MLKREIKYEDFEGNEVTEVFYFNISKSELIELEVSTGEGFSAMIEEIIKAKNNAELVSEFKKLVLMAYGEKSEDGKRFVKSDQLREDFKHSAAYDALFMELATDDKAAVAFLSGVLPKDIVGAVDRDKPALPKVAPSPPKS